MMLSRLLKLIKAMSFHLFHQHVLYEIITGHSEYEPKQVSLKEEDITIALIKWIINGYTVSVDLPRK